MKKTFLYILIIFLLIGFFSPNLKVGATDPKGACTLGNQKFPDLTQKECTDKGPTANWIGYYYPLAPLPGLGNRPDKGIDTTETDSTGEKSVALGAYLNTMIKIIIGIAAILSVVMIVIGGIEYMTSELVSSKEAGKETIKNALFGLLVALGAYALLNTINPDLLNTDIAISGVTVKVDLSDLGGEASAPFVPISKTALAALGIDCPESGGKGATERIGRSFMGKVVYSQDPARRNKISGSKVTLDCSAFVAQVYRCAGLGYPGGTSAEMFGSASRTRATTDPLFDFTKLNPGDIVGWKATPPSPPGERNGHVMIYLGNGQILDVANPPGDARVAPLSAYQSRITFVKWSP
ncbi:MAG: NlpC/P60 family protein [Patescibacteria group bacterium]